MYGWGASPGKSGRGEIERGYQRVPAPVYFIIHCIAKLPNTFALTSSEREFV